MADIKKGPWAIAYLRELDEIKTYLDAIIPADEESESHKAGIADIIQAIRKRSQQK